LSRDYDAATVTAKTSDIALRGGWLLAARGGWIILAVFILALNIVMIPRYDVALLASCHSGQLCFALQLTPYDEGLLRQLNLSHEFLAAYQVALEAITVALNMALGALIFSRKSTDRMALFCAYTLIFFGGVSLPNILQDTLAHASSLWLVVMSALVVLGHSCFSIFFCFFPSGRYAPNWLRWIAVAIFIYWIVEILIAPDSASGITPDNIILFALLLCLVFAQIYRYRRVSTPKERLQTKWVVLGFGVAILGFVLTVFLGSILLPSKLLDSTVVSVLVANTATYAFLWLIPISIAIAVLRSHLYDIDVIIRRTLIYGSLTAILTAIFFGLIYGAQALLWRANITTSQSPLVIVISTLLIAALAQPLRARIQAAIDRRFYRRKYDVARTLEGFGATIRSEVELGDLATHLVTVVEETMQPASISLWLRAAAGQNDAMQSEGEGV
jgi:hypothetical protein